MTSKMKLELEALVVESFETGDAHGARGTVHGHAVWYTRHCNTDGATCDAAATCDGAYSCNVNDNTCMESCGICGTNKCTGGDGDLSESGCVSGISTCPGCMNC